MPRPRTPEAYLLVEGEDDQHVVWQLCAQHGLPERFSVEVPEGNVGISGLLEGVPSRVKIPNLRIIGIMFDADQNPLARWQALRDRLQDPVRLQGYEYRSLPTTPPAAGWVSDDPDRPRVGIWLMPDNHNPGTLEDFATRLIPEHDALLPRAHTVLDEIDSAGLRRYRPAHRPKALIHTWLAWQANPGHPMGLAIKAGALRHDAPPALELVRWLRRLFGLSGA